MCTMKLVSFRVAWSIPARIILHIIYLSRRNRKRYYIYVGAVVYKVHTFDSFFQEKNFLFRQFSSVRFCWQELSYVHYCILSQKLAQISVTNKTQLILYWFTWVISVSVVIIWSLLSWKKNQSCYFLMYMYRLNIREFLQNLVSGFQTAD